MIELGYTTSYIGKYPTYKTSGAACFDIPVPFDFTIESHSGMTISLNIGFSIPKGYCLQVYPRSSTFNRGFICPVSIIDSDYTKYIHMQLYNYTDKQLKVEAGEHIVQAKLVAVHPTKLIRYEQLDQTGRGGLGSTGL